MNEMMESCNRMMEGMDMGDIEELESPAGAHGLQSSAHACHALTPVNIARPLCGNRLGRGEST